MEKKVTSHITKGLIIALVFIILDLVAVFTDWRLHNWYGIVTGLLMLGAFIWACISYANEMNNAVTFGNVFVHGFKASAVVAVFMFVYALLLVNFISPGIIDAIIEKSIEEAQKDGKFNSDISDEELERGMELGRKIGKIGFYAGSLLMTLVIGAIGSVLGAAFAKKNPPTPFS